MKRRRIELLPTHGILHIDTSEYLFDLEDLDLIQSRNWYPDKDGYLVCGYYYLGRYQVSRFHRIVMHAKPGEFVDHIDKNRKDNRKRNLRRCAFTENDRNRGLYSTNTSGVTGVFYDKERGMWLANISYNGKRVYIGRYKFKEGAIQARLNKEIELFGKYAPQRALWDRRCHMNKMQWNVFRENINRREIEVFDIFHHTSFNDDVIKLKKKKLSREEFAKELRSIAMYYFWSKCEHEVVITSWPPYIEKEELVRMNTEEDGYCKYNVKLTVGKKVDIYQQLSLNWETFVDYVFNF